MENMDEETVRRLAKERVKDFLKGDDTYSVHGPYLRPDGRKHAIILDKSRGTLTKRTVSWPKLIAEILLDGNVFDNDTIDHVDRDFTNDDIFNLRVIGKSKNSSDDALRVKVDDVNCPECGVLFTPSKDQRNSREKAGPFCSRSCSGKYGAAIQNGADKIERTEIIKTYYKFEK